MTQLPDPYVPGTIDIRTEDYHRTLTNTVLDVLLHYGLIAEIPTTSGGYYAPHGTHMGGCVEQFLAAFDLRKDASIPLCDACWKKAENGDELFPLASREDETTYLTALRRLRYELEQQAEALGAACTAHGHPAPGAKDDHYTTLADKLRGTYETLETFNAQIYDLEQAINPKEATP